MLLIILLSIFAFLIMVSIFVATLFFFYLRSSSGIILFKIDNINKRVLRLSAKYHFFSIIFDSKKTKFNQYSYIELSEFYKFFDKKTRGIISEYIDNPKDQKELAIEFNNNFYNNKNLTLFERIVIRLDTTLKKHEPYFLTINNVGNGNYICSIKWNRKKVFDDRIVLPYFKNNLQELKTNSESNYVLAFALKPYYFINQIAAEDISSIYNMLAINEKKHKFFYNRDSLFVVIPKKRKSKGYYTHFSNIIAQINKSFVSSKLFIAATIFEYGKISANQDLNNISNLINYSIFKILNDRSNYENYINMDKNFIESDQYKNFLDSYVTYIRKNTSNEFGIVVENVVNYNSQNASDIQIAKIITKDFDPSLEKFFKNIPYLNFRFELAWYTYIQNKLPNVSKKTLFKVSQEVFIHDQFTHNEKSPSCLVYAYDSVFNYHQLKTIITENLEHKIPTSIYVNTIDKPILNLIDNLKIQLIVIGGQIASKIDKTDILFDCINITLKAKKNNTKTIYENLPKNLDSFIVKKADILGTYSTK